MAIKFEGFEREIMLLLSYDFTFRRVGTQVDGIIKLLCAMIMSWITKTLPIVKCRKYIMYMHASTVLPAIGQHWTRGRLQLHSFQGSLTGEWQ